MEIVAPSFQGDELRAAFLAADLDGDGTIDRREFLLRAPQYAAVEQARLAVPLAANRASRACCAHLTRPAPLRLLWRRASRQRLPPPSLRPRCLAPALLTAAQRVARRP